jgi:hypothetical protein
LSTLKESCIEQQKRVKVYDQTFKRRPENGLEEMNKENATNTTALIPE